MEIVALWLIASIVVAVAARARGRSGFGWWLLAMAISPLLAVVLLALLPVPGGASGGRAAAGGGVATRLDAPLSYQAGKLVGRATRSVQPRVALAWIAGALALAFLVVWVHAFMDQNL